MRDTIKKVVDSVVRELISYKEKVGINSLAFKMVLGTIKAQCKDDVEIQEATFYLVESLKLAKLWVIARETFEARETYEANYLAFQIDQWKKGFLLKCPVSTNRFVLRNPITKEYRATGINFGKTTLQQEAIRHELVTGEKSSKKEIQAKIK